MSRLPVSVECEEPFFMYFAATENHLPSMPHPRFHGTSSLGRLMELSREQGLRMNTLVIFTTDKGLVLFDGYLDMPEGKQMVRRDGNGSRERVIILAPVGLFHLAEDLGEDNSLAKAYPQRLESMKALLDEIRAGATRHTGDEAMGGATFKNQPT